MESLFDYAQFGVAIFAIGVLCYVIKEFLRFMTKQEENFRETINSHMKDATQVAGKQIESSQNLNRAVEELLTFLRYSNGKNKKENK